MIGLSVIKGVVQSKIEAKLKQQGYIDMKRFSIFTLVVMLALTVSACGAKVTPPPTLSVIDIQNTSAAVALTMIAQTQAALPTVTPSPLPPTETFVNTLAPLTAFIPSPAPAELTLTAAPNGASATGDPCINQVLPDTLQGNAVKIRVNNSTKATVNLTVYLNRTTPPVVCGYRAYTLEPGGGLVISNMVEGCFTLWAWNPDPKGYFMVTNGAASCIDGSYPVAFDISNRDIKQR